MTQKQLDFIVLMALSAAVICGFTLFFFWIGWVKLSIACFVTAGALTLLDMWFLFFWWKRKPTSMNSPKRPPQPSSSNYSFNSTDFDNLIRGKTVIKPGANIALQDIGYDTMKRLVYQAKVAQDNTMDEQVKRVVDKM